MSNYIQRAREEVLQSMAKMDGKTLFWGYLHTNGCVITKRYFNHTALEDAKDSPFVEKFYGPFPAENSAKAEEFLIKMLKGE